MDHSTMPIEDHYLIPSYSKLPFSVEKGQGCYVFDEQGNRFLDLYGGHAVALLGHSHPALIQAMVDQASKLFFYSNVAYNSARAMAAKSLVDWVGGDRQVFFSNSGAEANENALKLAQIVTGKDHFVSFSGSFHGRTQGALAMTGIRKYRDSSSSKVQFAKFGDIEDLERRLDGSVAAVMFEAIQSLSGVVTASKEYFQAAVKLCKNTDTLIIFDEIQTGLGRCGHEMYFHDIDINPDFVTLAKGAAGGYPVGITLAKRDLVKDLKPGHLGSTFGGGPLACALITKTLSILKNDHLVGRAREQGDKILSILKNTRHIHEVRGQGLLLGLKTDVPASDLIQRFLKKGIIVGGSLDPHIVRLLPPLTLSDKDISLFEHALREIF